MEEPDHTLEFPAEPLALTASVEPNQHDSRPCSPSGDEYPLVLAPFAIAQISPDLLDHDEVNSLQGDELRSFRDYEYHSSASSTGHSSDILARDLEDEKLLRGPSRTSSHSSVSSIPPSALVHLSDALKPRNTAKAPRQTRHRNGAFRRQGSVPSIQIHSDDESDEYDTSWRGGGPRYSDFSMRSAGSPPMKRLPYYPSRGSASKQSIRSEYPLILLHCNLLPPSLRVVGYTGVPNQKILKEVLPQKYYRRWKLLEEKVGPGVLRDRGVLISHPEDTYDLLEERLLESLELQQPRLHHGHFLGQYEYDSDRDDNTTDYEQGEVCPDCGGRVVTCNDRNRKWEIRVFAANGLMRTGAWAAAWKEMEKVDVEVGLWLPGNVRRDLERRLSEETEFKVPLQVNGWPDKVTATHPPSAQEQARSPSMGHGATNRDIPICTENQSSTSASASQGDKKPSSKSRNQTSATEIDLQTLLINYIRVLASDRRNIAIGILSIFVVFLAIGGARIPTSSSSKLRAFPQEMFGSVPTSVVSTAYSSTEGAVTSEVSSSIPASVEVKTQIPFAEEHVHASIPTATEFEDSPSDVDDADITVSSAESSGVFDKPDTAVHEISGNVDDQSEGPPVIESMEPTLETNNPTLVDE